MTEPGFTVWITGLSGAGKSTIARQLAAALRQAGRLVEVLDGDEIRATLNSDLGFSKDARDANVRRIGFVARLLARNGVAVVVAAISPYRAVRDEVRAAVEAEGCGFVEVYARCSIDELARRDVKGLYQKALRGDLPGFTGVSDPYEEPLSPDVVFDSESESEQDSLSRLLEHLHARGYLLAVPAPR